ncbi:ribbon-helix-helix protein, CopG family [Candidatus Palauibacter sp.]|uniref:ribbon-helix-helix protein, CopG family n=1 Tax=Candidatus Palauibacter sp. TaxID=3101350 RepID=UPI003AF25B3E
MATTTIKSTYSLDVETVRMLEELASRWNTSKSEVVRRAIRAAAARDESVADGPLAALRQLQDSVRSRGVDLDQWVREVRAERRAWTMSPPAHEARGE